jgi:hypothetical protein
MEARCHARPDLRDPEAQDHLRRPAGLGTGDRHGGACAGLLPAKLFSGASTKFGAEPNSNVAFVDAGMPGMLPVINEFCVAQAVGRGWA